MKLGVVGVRSVFNRRSISGGGSLRYQLAIAIRVVAPLIFHPPFLFFCGATMSTTATLSVAQYELIKAHNAVLSDSAENQIMVLRAIPQADRPPYIQGQLNYWIHAVKALKWSTAIAAQRAGVKTDG